MQICTWTMYLILCKQIAALFLIEVVQCNESARISREWYLFRGLVLVLAVSCLGRSLLLSPYIVFIPAAMTTLYMRLLDKHWKRDSLTVIK
uniref:Uncharacterized protein n=1 Tax=Nomascus leucogenys TaxID=61853 RepID=A0A2I3HNS1_NOMLE